MQRFHIEALQHSNVNVMAYQFGAVVVVVHLQE
jgi:hypothetical protein